MSMVEVMPIFVVQEHWATHHHFDFRLEVGGVLKSWAIPKEIPTKKGEKRLAVQVEDHDLEYANFEGEIPEGQYGAGKVKIWDKGKYKIIEENQKKLKFRLFGKKLKGIYELINFKDKNWLLFKVEE
jgi:DNA ligase D-like protein (predicted 3'-phosphoesterase)